MNNLSTGWKKSIFRVKSLFLKGSQEKKIVVVGGGLTGLVAAILLNRKHLSVLVIEKKRYPFHRVCGEYISNETLPFLKKTGLFPQEFEVPSIKRLQLTAVSGHKAEIPLALGGFGISRYYFDHFLYKLAVLEGVQFRENTEVQSVAYHPDSFHLELQTENISADVVLGSFGKRSKIDHALNRKFIQLRSPYVGVKYHIHTQHPADLIALHNFEGGYCGISNIESGMSNLCYLTHRDNVKRHKTIGQMEKNILYRNPFLKSLFENSTFLFEKPEVINEISFATKQPVENHILMSGDAAGMITPLCGNGMAMAIQSAKIASEWIELFCQDRISRSAMEIGYSNEWRKKFAGRLWAGRQIQRLFGSAMMSNAAVNLATRAPFLANYLVGKTHGQPF